MGRVIPSRRYGRAKNNFLLALCLSRCVVYAGPYTKCCPCGVTLLRDEPIRFAGLFGKDHGILRCFNMAVFFGHWGGLLRVVVIAGMGFGGQTYFP